MQLIKQWQSNLNSWASYAPRDAVEKGLCSMGASFVATMLFTQGNSLAALKAASVALVASAVHTIILSAAPHCAKPLPSYVPHAAAGIGFVLASFYGRKVEMHIGWSLCLAVPLYVLTQSQHSIHVSTPFFPVVVSI